MVCWYGVVFRIVVRRDDYLIVDVLCRAACIVLMFDCVVLYWCELVALLCIRLLLCVPRFVYASYVQCVCVDCDDCRVSVNVLY